MLAAYRLLARGVEISELLYPLASFSLEYRSGPRYLPRAPVDRVAWAQDRAHETVPTLAEEEEYQAKYEEYERHLDLLLNVSRFYVNSGTIPLTQPSRRQSRLTGSLNTLKHLHGTWSP